MITHGTNTVTLMKNLVGESHHVGNSIMHFKSIYFHVVIPLMVQIHAHMQIFHKRVGVVGPEPGLLWAGLKALDRRAGDGTTATLIDWLWMWCTSAIRTRRKKGRQRLRP